MSISWAGGWIAGAGWTAALNARKRPAPNFVNNTSAIGPRVALSVQTKSTFMAMAKSETPSRCWTEFNLMTREYYFAAGEFSYFQSKKTMTTNAARIMATCAR